MMELPLSANLMIAGFEGNPSAPSPVFSSGGFNSLLLNQMTNMEEGLCYENGCEEKFLFRLSEESFSPRSEEKEPLSYNNFNILVEQALIHPLNVPFLPEGQGLPTSFHQPPDPPLFMPGPTHFPKAIGADIQAEPSLFSGKFGEGRASFIAGHPDGLERPASNTSCPVSSDQLNLPFKSASISQRLEESVDQSSYQVRSEKIASDVSLFTKGVPENVKELINAKSGHHEELFSIFQTKGKDAESSPMTAKMEMDGQRALTSFNRTAVSLEKGGPDLTLKFEFIGEPHLSGSNPDPENDNHRLVSLKNDPSLSESSAVKNGAGPELKMEHFMPEEVPKAQNGFSPKAESLDIYHQIGRKMVWSVQNGEERIKLTLDPPRLGNLYMEVIKEKEMVSATLWAESTATKELLDAHREELRRILESDGFKLEKFDVFVQQETRDFQDGGRHLIPHGQKSLDGFVENQASPGEHSGTDPNHIVNLFHRGNRYIDLFV
jgi:hypothetical protein